MKIKILIADDKEENLYLLESLLKGNGYEVTTVENGKQALEAALANPPDLIISDILMPVMDGFTLIRKWKNDKTLRNIPFVFYTATYTDARDEEFALHLGVDRFIIKPQDPDIFIEIIRELLQHVKEGEFESPSKPEVEETIQLREYNQALIRKLEDKIAQTDEAHKIINRSPVVTFLWKNEKGWPVEFVSENVVNLTGYSGELFRTRKMIYAEIIHPEDIDRVTGEVSIHSKNDESQAFTHEPYRILTRNGDIKWVSDITYIRRDTKGGITHFEGIVSDITTRKEAEQKIESQLEELQKWHSVTLGREERMIELKKEVNTLLERLGEPLKYRDNK